jgi:hypothetical protein
MGIKLKLLRFDDADVTRLAQYVQLAFDQIPDVATGKAVSINRDTSLSENVEFAFVDSSGGPVTISLPASSDRTLTFRSVTNSGNAVKIQAATAAKINGTQSFLTLGALTTLVFRYNPTTKAWWSL